MSKNTLSLKVYGDLQTDTFLESLVHEESENQCLHLHRFLQGQYFFNFRVTANKIREF